VMSQVKRVAIVCIEGIIVSYQRRCKRILAGGGLGGSKLESSFSVEKEAKILLSV